LAFVAVVFGDDVISFFVDGDVYCLTSCDVTFCVVVDIVVPASYFGHNLWVFPLV